MHADAALIPSLRDRAVPDSRLDGVANLLIMPNLDAANISFTMLKAGADGLPIGPILLGMSRPIHVLVPSVTARGIVNVSAMVAVEAQHRHAESGGKVGKAGGLTRHRHVNAGRRLRNAGRAAVCGAVLFQSVRGQHQGVAGLGRRVGWPQPGGVAAADRARASGV